MHLVDFSLGWLKHVEPPSHPKNYGSSICTRSFWAFRAFSSDGDSNMNVIKPGSHEIPQNHVSRSLIFSKCYRKKGSATSPKFNIEPENGFQKESAFPGFHVNQYPQNAKSRNFPQKNPPLPSGCCDFFSSSLVFCNLKKRHRHVEGSTSSSFLCGWRVALDWSWLSIYFGKAQQFPDIPPLRNLVACW